jgi:hypothetical protein
MSRRTLLGSLVLCPVLAAGIASAQVAESEPAAASKIKQRSGAEGAVLTGVVEADETKRVLVSARMKGRIDKLYANANGQTVQKGDALARLYSPDLAVTARELLDAQRSGNREIQDTARERLQLFGMDNSQIDEVLKTGKPADHLTLRSPIGGHVIRKFQVEGGYVKESTKLFELADLSTAWIEAEVTDEAAPLVLKEGQSVSATVKAFPNRTFTGTLIGSFQDEKSRILKARFAIENARHELRPGMRAIVLLKAPGVSSDKEADKLKQLRQERLATLRELVEQTQREYQAGKASFDQLHQATQALLHAELELCSSDKERIVVLEKILAQAKQHEETAVQRYKSGNVTASDALRAKAARLEAEVALERTKSRLAAGPK